MVFRPVDGTGRRPAAGRPGPRNPIYILRLESCRKPTPSSQAASPHIFAGALPGAPTHPVCCSHILAPCASSLLCAAARLLLPLFSNSIPGHTARAPPTQTQPAVRVGFELATDGIQFYVFAN